MLHPVDIRWRLCPLLGHLRGCSLGAGHVEPVVWWRRWTQGTARGITGVGTGIEMWVILVGGEWCLNGVSVWSIGCVVVHLFND